MDINSIVLTLRQQFLKKADEGLLFGLKPEDFRCEFNFTEDQDHQGFFIEFDITKFPFKYHGPFPINYQKEIEPISISECGPALGMLMQTNLKYKDWEHENEWRLLLESDDNMISTSFELLRKLAGRERKFFYPTAALRKIGLGNRFFYPHELNSRNEKELDITLDTSPQYIKRSKLRAELLDFIIDKKIEFYMGLRGGICETYFAPTVVTKADKFKYLFVAINVPSAQAGKH